MPLTPRKAEGSHEQLCRTNLTNSGFHLTKRVVSGVSEASLLLQQHSRSLPLQGAIAEGTKKTAVSACCHSSPLALYYVLLGVDPATCHVSGVFVYTRNFDEVRRRERQAECE